MDESSGLKRVNGSVIAEANTRVADVLNCYRGKRCYIAGPMRGIPYFNFPEFARAEQIVRDMGMIPISPAAMDLEHGFDPMQLPEETDWTDLDALGFDLRAAIRRDLNALQTCEVIYLLDGWKNSRGATAEHAVARWLGLQILDPHFAPHYGAIDASGPVPSELRDILDIASEITRGDRQASYGPPDQDFRRTAAMWSALKGIEFEPWEVAQFMIALKLSRETHQRKRDNAVDIAGYARCLDVCNRAAGVY